MQKLKITIITLMLTLTSAMISHAETKYEGGNIYAGSGCMAKEAGTIYYSWGAAYNRSEKPAWIVCPIIREKDKIKGGYIRFIDTINNTEHDVESDVTCFVRTYARFDGNTRKEKAAEVKITSSGNHAMPASKDASYSPVDGIGMITKNIPGIDVYDAVSTLHPDAWENAPASYTYRYATYFMECRIPGKTTVHDKDRVLGLASYQIRE